MPKPSIPAPTPFNPLDKTNLGISVADALLGQTVHPLPPESPFIGAGIYAIYYSGDFQAYKPLLPESPIYVGKAVPQGARKGGFGLGLPAGQVLFKRLREHAESIRATELDIKGFTCRFLVVDDIWIPLGETLLIERFKPIWNVLIDGFGNHDPGKGRYGGMRPAWDVLHPGRSWAERCRPHVKRTEQIASEVADFFAGKIKPDFKPEDILNEDDGVGQD